MCVCMCVYTSLCTFGSPDLHVPELVHDYSWVYTYMLSVPLHIYVHVFLCMKVAEKSLCKYANVCLSRTLSLHWCVYTCVSLHVHMCVCETVDAGSLQVMYSVSAYLCAS